MPDRLRFATLDVFTDKAFTGNPLAVVEAADGLSDAAMQTIAREFNLSETIFVQTPDDPTHAAKVRIFLPTAELPFAGHPTIGCALHLDAAAHGEGETTLVLEEVAGDVPVRIWSDTAARHAEFTAPVIPVRAAGVTGPGIGDIADALGLAEADIGFQTHVPGVFEGGPRFLFVPVATLGALSRAHPSEPAWSAMTDQAQAQSAFLYSPTEGGYQARMFAPGKGIPEDPATGSACAILAAQLLASQALSDGETRLVLYQGAEMGRPSLIGLRIEVADQRLVAVHVSGQAVPISEGSVRVPNDP